MSHGTSVGLTNPTRYSPLKSNLLIDLMPSWLSHAVRFQNPPPTIPKSPTYLPPQSSHLSWCRSGTLLDSSSLSHPFMCRGVDSTHGTSQSTTPYRIRNICARKQRGRLAISPPTSVSPLSVESMLVSLKFSLLFYPARTLQCVPQTSWATPAVHASGRPTTIDS